MSKILAECDCLLSIHLAPEEVATVDVPDALFLVVPRFSYLPSYYPLIIDHFSDHVAGSVMKARYVCSLKSLNRLI